ncbi:DUF2971 domain-containing protein [Rathayibacter festucae]|nr:DUF2971 domain-containing protein [Rathayibacter festucae]
MNDTEEVQQFLNLIVDVLRREARRRENDDLASALYMAADNFNRWIEVNYFVVSFSSDPDSLSQWRGYAGGGQGYALGFERSMFQNMPGWRLVECVYEEVVALDLARSIVYEGMRVVREGDYNYELEDARIYTAIYSRAMTEAPVLKHPAFKEEHELRLIGGPFGRVAAKVRAGKRGIMPYVELDWPIGEDGYYHLREVVAGPGAREDTFHGLDIATSNDEKFELFVDVLGSDAPYRS